jgi:glucose/arabinose dehydrogenase
MRLIVQIPMLCTIIAAATLGCGSTASSAAPTPVDTTLTRQIVVSGLSEPVFLTAAPGDTGRLFIIEKAGRIRIVKHGVLLSTPFLDITGKTSTGGEQGLLGMAFYPDYATSGRFIVSYTSPLGALPGGTSIIARYSVSANADVATPGSEQILLTVDQPYTNHNGGMVAFGPDAYLYVGFGDGGSGGDPDGHGQNRTDLLGSILRLDVSGPGGYTIPPDNPYAGSATLAKELWNYGLRNPWRFSFDRMTGGLYIGDVGQDAHEEVDVAASGVGGQNYGWNIMEGLSCYGGAGCDQTGLTLPALDYGHGQECSVTGGYVYRGSAIPAPTGHYFYGDYCSGRVWSFRYQGGQATDRREWPAVAAGGGLTSFGEDARGELYFMLQSGTVYRIVAP